MQHPTFSFLGPRFSPTSTRCVPVAFVTISGFADSVSSPTQNGSALFIALCRCPQELAGLVWPTLPPPPRFFVGSQLLDLPAHYAAQDGGHWFCLFVRYRFTPHPFYIKGMAIVPVCDMFRVLVGHWLRMASFLLPDAGQMFYERALRFDVRR